mmetsp:Transcript_87449/g.187604  ORF Transcript_87449/g.187604 Transcript_87449/m.187604 type:complete len:278 (+) Transcript_87449:376-1209(+)
MVAPKTSCSSLSSLRRWTASACLISSRIVPRQSLGSCWMRMASSSACRAGGSLSGAVWSPSKVLPASLRLSAASASRKISKVKPWGVACLARLAISRISSMPRELFDPLRNIASRSKGDALKASTSGWSTTGELAATAGKVTSLLGRRSGSALGGGFVRSLARDDPRERGGRALEPRSVEFCVKEARHQEAVPPASSNRLGSSRHTGVHQSPSRGSSLPSPDAGLRSLLLALSCVADISESIQDSVLSVVPRPLDSAGPVEGMLAPTSPNSRHAGMS